MARIVHDKYVEVWKSAESGVDAAFAEARAYIEDTYLGKQTLITVTYSVDKRGDHYFKISEMGRWKRLLYRLTHRR